MLLPPCVSPALLLLAFHSLYSSRGMRDNTCLSHKASLWEPNVLRQFTSHRHHDHHSKPLSPPSPTHTIRRGAQAVPESFMKPHEGCPGCGTHGSLQQQQHVACGID